MKKLKIAIIILIIINLLITLYLIFYKKEEKIEIDETISPKEYTENLDSTFINNEVIPQKSYELAMVYDGDIELNEVYKKLEVLINEVVVEVNAIKGNSQKLNKYYEDNENLLKNEAGITSKEDFEKLVNILKQYKYTNYEYLHCEYISDSYVSTSNDIEFKLKINYESNYIINIKVILNDREKLIKFIPIEGDI